MYRTLFVVGTKWASRYYRMTQAVDAMNARGYKTDCTTITDLIVKDYKSLKLIPSGEERSIDDYDVFVFQLVSVPLYMEKMKYIKSQGKIVVHEVDDDYFNLPADNPAWYAFHPKYKIEAKEGGKVYQPVQYADNVNTRMENFREACRISDWMQVSTPELAELYRGMCGGCVVLQNSVDNTLYDAGLPRFNIRTPVIGWCGTRTHLDDLRNVWGCFPENTPQVFAGFPEIKKLLFKDNVPSNVEILNEYTLEELVDIISKMDIGIVPLTQNTFNDGKSDLKGVEYGASGIPCVASDVAPYRRWIRHGENGFLVKNNKTKFWIRYLRELVNDRELRIKMGAEAKKDAMKRDISIYVDEWINFYYGGGIEK